MKILHNPRCSKSRQTLALLIENSIKPEIVLYLENGLSKIELYDIVNLLGITPQQLVRKTEQIYKDLFKGKDMSDEEWVMAMLEYPKLIERPIVINGNHAIIGRPPTNVLDLIK